MAEDNYPQPPTNTSPTKSNDVVPVNSGESNIVVKFPYTNSTKRLSDYDYYRRLFKGEHFTAFNIRIDDNQYNKEYAKLRYVMVNFAGLVSKICADMLFSEPIRVKVPDGDQDFVDSFMESNHMNIQLYEAALGNSYRGDALFKLRIGPRYEGGQPTIIVEETTPSIYFPEINQFNVKEQPRRQELAWVFTSGGKKYLRKEIHSAGVIENQVFEMNEDEIGGMVSLGILGDIKGLVPKEIIKIKEPLLVHIPNWKTGDEFFGYSDYLDLDSIFYAINNRMTKIDNILDKHGDPILTVPPGILDEKGQVNKKSMGVIEVADGENGKPEYIVWDAKLESAFTEIEKLVDFMYLTAEISPDILGLGEGKTDSGKALKFKLMRTIAKVARKKLYFDAAIKDLVYRAQLLAKAYKVGADGVALKSDPVKPEIIWADGLPADDGELLDNETKALDAGITSQKSSIMRVYGVDEESAEKMQEEIKKENEVSTPKMDPMADPFSKKDDKTASK